MGVCFRICSILVALLAILIGLLVSGFLAKYTPLFVYLDRNSLGSKGMTPAFHRDVPYGFTFEELYALDLSGHIILITGANVGLGYWSAYHLVKTDAHVVIACRTLSKCNEAAEKIRTQTGKNNIEALELDLADFDSIRNFAAVFKAKHKFLDSLMLNAGVALPSFTKTKQGLELQIGVNHFGHFLLTQELTPLLKEAAKIHDVATVCVVSSAAHYGSYPEGILPTIELMNDETRYDLWKSYGQSKLANVLFAQELAIRLRSENVLVNAIHPGAVQTELGRNAGERLSKLIGESLTRYLYETLNAAMWSAEEAALTQIYASVGPSLKQKRITGKYFHPIARETTPDIHAQNKSLQQRLWEITEQFVSTN